MTKANLEDGLSSVGPLQPVQTWEMRRRLTAKQALELHIPHIDAARWPRTADAFQRAFTGTMRDREAVFR